MKSTIVIGGGFFGMYLADYLAQSGQHVVLCEKETDFMQRASYVNQARVHNGYHYPRSILTAMRSHALFSRFCNEFPEALDKSFEKYYMVSKLLSKVTAKQFEVFCKRIGAPCEAAPQEITQLVNPHAIEAVFSTIEYGFDATKLKSTMEERLNTNNVECRLATSVIAVKEAKSGLDVAIKNQDGNIETINCAQVFNCTYALTNKLLNACEIPPIPLKHEMTEICLVEVPDILKNIGITVMCGPFFSTMPFPSRGLHSFTHVRYTPHYQWDSSQDVRNIQSNPKTTWRAMIADAKRYIPILAKCEYKESIWETKTVLPTSQIDDSRPILFKQNYGIKGLHCIIGGKIDNVYDMVEIVDKMGLGK